MRPSTLGTLALLASSLTGTALAAGTTVRVPLVCTRGPSDQVHVVSVSAPASVAPGATYTVRIDGVSSGEISHVGLHYVFDMTTDYLVPVGTAYVPGSARIVPGTGTANVGPGARVTYERGVIRLVLPGRVASGSSYTPPSIELQLTVAAPVGTTLRLGFSQYRLKASAFLVGELATVCDPRPKPYPIASMRVVPPVPPSGERSGLPWMPWSAVLTPPME